MLRLGGSRPDSIRVRMYTTRKTQASISSDTIQMAKVSHLRGLQTDIGLGKAMMSTTTLRPADSDASEQRTRFLDRPARNIAMTAASLLVVASIGLFLVGPQGSPGVTFSLTSYAISSRNVVIYGKVSTASHQPVSGAEGQIYRVVGGRAHTLASFRTSRQGIYRLVVRHLRSATVHENISIWLHGRHYRGVVRFFVRRGRAYGVDAHLAGRGSLFFLPISSY